MLPTAVELTLVAVTAVAVVGWLRAFRRGAAEPAPPERETAAGAPDQSPAEAAREESDRRLRRFTDALPVLFAYIDKDRRYRFCNLQFEKHFRKSRDQILGATAPEFLGPRTYDQVAPLLDRALAGENVFYESWIEYPETGRAFMRGSLVPDVSDLGEVRGVFVMEQDMTAKKTAEDNLARAKEKAEATSASKSRFLAVASHDLRQPMQALAMFIEVLASREHDDVSRDIVEKIQASSKALERLLNTLLDISRLEADLVKPAIRQVTLGELTERLVAEVAPLAEGKGIELRHVRSELAAMTDPGLLDRILRNLLNNAIAHTDKGRVLVGCRRRGDMIAVEVWDTGVGIAEDQKSKIFDEFFRGDPERKDLGGLGLGLTIVDRLATLMGHRIEVDSVVGRGSVFRVLVPPVNGDVAVLTPPEATPGTETSEGALIVGIDDDPAVRDALSLLLQSWGFEVLVAASEADAVTQLSAVNRTPDMVIADYRLSEGDRGSNAINAIRRRWGGRIPGLLLTGESDPNGLAEADASGYQVVKKPIRPEKLRAVVAEQMHARNDTTGGPDAGNDNPPDGRKQAGGRS